MSKELSYQLENEVKAILQQHLSMVAEYTTSMNPADIILCDNIREDLSILDDLCQTSPLYASRETYQQARQHLERIRNLLQLINSSAKSTMFQNSELGNLWKRANDWCDRLDTRYDVPDEEIWDIIAPVVPDVLNRVRHNLYEAIWWKPVPQMDIEILRRTENVIIEDFESEATGRPGLVMVRFSIHR